ncbi:MAG: lysylphosphatidylglycerol synthase transmembrane domain-containing protein [Balneolales bacterium]
MRSTIRNILLSLLVGGVFFWLAIRNVPLETLFDYMQGISYWWILPYALVALGSHYIRAERWRLLIRDENINPSRNTLFAGVMFGYLVNYAVPRLGEITRCVYAAKKEDLSGTNLIGTVILERVIDMLVVMLLIGFVALVVISDTEALTKLFGEETLTLIRSVLQLETLLYGFGGLIIAIWLGYLSVRLIRQSALNRPWMENVITRLRGFVITFVDGLLAIRRVRQWPYFIGLTLLIWLGYVVMAYIPFFVFNLHEDFGLGFTEALVIMTISTIGVALPSPGGIGTYHWFVRQGLLVLYGVPVAVGFAYAFVTHAVMMGIVLISSPIILVWNNWFLNRQ